jgi:hypothetical protein
MPRSFAVLSIEDCAIDAAILTPLSPASGERGRGLSLYRIFGVFIADRECPGRW